MNTSFGCKPTVEMRGPATTAQHKAGITGPGTEHDVLIYCVLCLQVSCKYNPDRKAKLPNGQKPSPGQGAPKGFDNWRDDPRPWY
jgi:hypothetical protein